jgi:predicted ribosomally synthesized peptide with SipW-like signal peptide
VIKIKSVKTKIISFVIIIYNSQPCVPGLDSIIKKGEILNEKKRIVEILTFTIVLSALLVAIIISALGSGAYFTDSNDVTDNEITVSTLDGF